MNRKELTYRLSVLGLKKGDFAKTLGLVADTLYQWDETPQYAEALLVTMEQLAACREELRAALGNIAALKAGEPKASDQRKARKK